MFVKNPNAVTLYAEENAQDGTESCVMKVTLVEECEYHKVDWTGETWEDGIPVTKGFERNNPVPLFLPAGITLKGVLYNGRASGMEIFEFPYGSCWYRVYPSDGTLCSEKNVLREPAVAV